MLLAICEEKLAFFASTDNYFRPGAGWGSHQLQGGGCGGEMSASPTGSARQMADVPSDTAASQCFSCIQRCCAFNCIFYFSWS